MRLENSVNNLKAAWMLQLVHILCQFVSRTVIIKVLAIEYVGLSGLFSNVLMMISLAELGIGEAIIFSLYRPIAKGQREDTNAIMSFYKKVYIAIGIFIMIIGMAITPFIGSLIKDMPNIPGIYAIYMLYVVNSSVSYFFSYKATFITANQNNYLVVINNGLWEVIMVVTQVLILITTKNYILYMAVGIGFILAQNISITIIANRRYPYLKNKEKNKVPKKIMQEIKKNTGAMIFHKAGAIIVFATDNIILSKFIGLISVGIYANYCTITNSVILFINKFFNAISASIGNLAVEESVEVQEKTFFKVQFINFWLYVAVCCCLFNLLNPFIANIWLNEKFLFNSWVVLLIVIKIYFSGMRSAAQTFKNAKGLYWQNRYMPIYESLINLIASILLVQYIGVAGVLLGTIISSVFTCVWIEPYVLYKYGFKKSAKGFYLMYAEYFFTFIFIMAVTYGCVFLVKGHDVIAFLLKFILCITVPNLIIIARYNKKDEFKYFIHILKKKVLKK